MSSSHRAPPATETDTRFAEPRPSREPERRRRQEREEEREHRPRRERDEAEGSSRRHREREERRHRSRSRSPRRSSRRSRSRSREHHASSSRRRSRSPSSRSGSSSGSETEDEEARRRCRRKEKERRARHKERRRERRRERSDEESDGETREERRERKRRKRDKKKAKAGKGAVLEYGKHGIISESDVTSRLTAEFRQWLVEERHINPETINRGAERKEMATFIEDFNTATFTNDKYYNLEAHERRMAMIRAGETLPVEGAYDPAADEAAVNAGFRAARREREAKKAGSGEAWQSKEQLEELRRVQNERIEAAKMKQLGLEVSSRMGMRMDGTKFDR